MNSPQVRQGGRPVRTRIGRRAACQSPMPNPHVLIARFFLQNAYVF